MRMLGFDGEVTPLADAAYSVAADLTTSGSESSANLSHVPPIVWRQAARLDCTKHTNGPCDAFGSFFRLALVREIDDFYFVF
jgi:hypothetical protein